MVETIAIASGKGGVGKTSLAVNCAIELSNQKSLVGLLDADFGLANAHIMLDQKVNSSVIDLLDGTSQVEDLVHVTSSGVKLIPGGSGVLEIMNIDSKKRWEVIKAVSYLENDLDFLFVDTPAGASDSSIEFAAACDKIIIVLVGEPTSFVDSYALLKAIFSKSSFKNYCIVVNQVQNDDQGKDLFLKFQKIATNFLDVNLHYVGSIKNSAKIRKSIINRVPIVSEEPKSDVSQSFLRVAQNIYKTPTNEWGGLTFLSKVKKRA